MARALLRFSTSRPVLLIAPVLACLWGLLALAEEGATRPLVHDIRLGIDGKGQTRIVLDMDARPDFRVTPLVGGTIEIAVAGASFEKDAAGATGLVAGITTRGEAVEARLSGTALPVRSFVLEPRGQIEHYRLVVDLGPATEAEYQEAARPRRPLAPPAAAKPAAAKPAKKSAERPLAALPVPRLKPMRAPSAADPVPALLSAKKIVIDPGHGGRDPGALGPTGLREEAVTLAAAQQLATILRARGYEVMLTREDDSYVDHEARIETARRAGADLFLSLHADAHEDPTLRGASVYTLSEKRSDRMARELKGSGDFHLYDIALSEEEREVGAILFDLANTATQNESGRLAVSLIGELGGTVPMINNTHRRASLKVLLAPDVPAVLVEMAFISNPQDERNLRSERWMRTAMGAVADGIDDYFGARMAARTLSSPAGG
jgi:N-acetylmuramoyl-L-alanine amidase